MFLDTDGIAEAMNEDHNEFNEVRLEAMLDAGRELPVDTVPADVADSLGRCCNRNSREGNNRTIPTIWRRPIVSACRHHLSGTARC